jgi:hypothetical protein
MQTPDWLSQDNPEALAEAIKRRIQGELGPRPDRDEWAWTEPVLSLVERSTEEPERSRVSKAILLLLEELAGTSDQKEEWPSGLLLVARRVLWSEEEMKKIGPLAHDLLESTSKWSLGHSSGPGLGSPALEVYRFARFAWAWNGLGQMLEDATYRLSSDLVEMKSKDEILEALHELGALMGLQLSVYGTKSERPVILRGLISEYEGWTDADPE